ncbi:MAG: helix-turn-helix domain-containing protein [Pseudomonadota bacterium]
MDAKIIEDRKGRRHALDACDSPCAIERGMRIIGGKWTGSILWHLKDGPVRFNDLSRMIAGASKKMISERLRLLEAQGLISRTVKDTAPVTVEYAITDFGRSALSVLNALKDWSEALPANALDSAQNS